MSCTLPVPLDSFSQGHATVLYEKVLEETKKQAGKRSLPDDDLADDDDDDDDWTAKGRAKKRSRAGQKKASRGKVL